MSTDPTNAELTTEQLRDVAVRIASKAKRCGVSDADIQRVLGPTVGELQALTSGLAESEESALQAAERLGLVGCVKNAPADLATNPKYLDGFGRDAANADSS